MTVSKLATFERIILFAAICLATFLIVLDYSIANVSIPYIAGDLGVSNDQGTYVITSFAVGNAIGLIMTGWLTKRVGEVKLISISIALFTLLSLFCGMSFSLEMLVVCRFIQGLVAGPAIPLSQSLIISQGTLETRARDLSIWSMIVITAPVIGPILGGYLSDWYHWSWIFYINIPVGIFCCITIWALLRQHETKTEKVPADVWGIIYLVIGVTCLQIFLDKGQEWDWWNSLRIRALIIGSIIAFTFLLIREIGFKNAFIKLRLFRYGSFTLSIICIMVSYAIYFGGIVIVPLWLQEYMGYNAEWAGITVSFLGIGPLFFSILTPLAVKKLGNVRTLMIGFFIFGAACFYSAFFTTDTDWKHFAFSRFFFGCSFVFYITPLFGLNVQEISRDQLPNATSIFHFVRAMVGGVGTAVFTTIWERRTYFHHQRIGETLTPYNPLLSTYDQQGLEILNNSVDKQAAMLAMNDSFYLMGWLFVGLLLMLVVWDIWNIRTGRSKRTVQQQEIHFSAE